jgi:hypothetical protein
MLAFTIRNRKTGWSSTFYDQCVNGALLEPFNGQLGNHLGESQKKNCNGDKSEGETDEVKYSDS